MPWITLKDYPVLYPLIIREHGTGKMSLIRLALNSLKEPKGVVYVDVPVHFVKAMQRGIGYEPGSVLDLANP